MSLSAHLDHEPTIIGAETVIDHGPRVTFTNTHRPEVDDDVCEGNDRVEHGHLDILPLARELQLAHRGEYPDSGEKCSGDVAECPDRRGDRRLFLGTVHVVDS